MKKLISYIEKGLTKEFFDHLNILLKDSSFDINQTFNKKDPKYSEIWTHTLFSYSCLYGRLDLCKHLASKNADPIGRGSSIGEGFPLAISILHNQFHISDWLQRTLDIDCSISNSWPLTVSAEYGNLSAVKYTLDHRADICTSVDCALRLAVYNSHLSIVKYLVSKGADIHADDNHALRWATWYNRFKIVECLLDSGADPNAKDNNGYILQLLIEKNQLDLAAKAVAYGADTSLLSSSQKEKLDAYTLSKKMTKVKKL